MKEETAEKKPGEHFVEVLTGINKGLSLSELDEKLREVVEAVRSEGKKGRLSFTLDIVPVPNSDGTQVMLLDDVKIKKPERPRKPALFFTTPDNGLSRTEPNQRDWIVELDRNAVNEE